MTVLLHEDEDFLEHQEHLRLDMFVYPPVRRASLRPFAAWVAAAFVAGAAAACAVQLVDVVLLVGFVGWLAIALAAVGISALSRFFAKRKEVSYAARDDLKALAGQRTGPSGTDRAGRVSERDGRRGPGGASYEPPHDRPGGTGHEETGWPSR